MSILSQRLTASSLADRLSASLSTACTSSSVLLMLSMSRRDLRPDGGPQLAQHLLEHRGHERLSDSGHGRRRLPQQQVHRPRLLPSLHSNKYRLQRRDGRTEKKTERVHGSPISHRVACTNGDGRRAEMGEEAAAFGLSRPNLKAQRRLTGPTRRWSMSRARCQRPALAVSEEDVGLATRYGRPTWNH